MIYLPCKTMMKKNTFWSVIWEREKGIEKPTDNSHSILKKVTQSTAGNGPQEMKQLRNKEERERESLGSWSGETPTATPICCSQTFKYLPFSKPPSIISSRPVGCGVREDHRLVDTKVCYNFIIKKKWQ